MKRYTVNDVMTNEFPDTFSRMGNTCLVSCINIFSTDTSISLRAVSVNIRVI